MRVPHRNYAPRAVTWRPHNHYQPSSKVPRRDIAGLAIILPLIRHGGVRPRKNLPGIGKIQPAMRKGGGALAWIIADRRGFNVVTKIVRCKRSVWRFLLSARRADFAGRRGVLKFWA
jgi:hypothetical protein